MIRSLQSRIYTQTFSLWGGARSISCSEEAIDKEHEENIVCHLALTELTCQGAASDMHLCVQKYSNMRLKLISLNAGQTGCARCPHLTTLPAENWSRQACSSDSDASPASSIVSYARMMSRFRLSDWCSLALGHLLALRDLCPG